MYTINHSAIVGTPHAEDPDNHVFGEFSRVAAVEDQHSGIDVAHASAGKIGVQKRRRYGHKVPDLVGR